jgi:hypothetical protein
LGILLCPRLSGLWSPVVYLRNVRSAGGKGKSIQKRNYLTSSRKSLIKACAIFHFSRYINILKMISYILALFLSTIVISSSSIEAAEGQLRGIIGTRALNGNLISCVDKVCKAGQHKFYFRYSFVDGCVLDGYTKSTDLLLEYCDGSLIKIDIGCTKEYSKEGYSTSPAFGPTKGVNPAIYQYTIKTLYSDCQCAYYCLHTASAALNLIPSLPFDSGCEEVTSFDGFRCINGECVENLKQEFGSSSSNIENLVSLLMP